MFWKKQEPIVPHARCSSMFKPRDLNENSVSFIFNVFKCVLFNDDTMPQKCVVEQQFGTWKARKWYSSYWAKRNSCWGIAWHFRKQFTKVLRVHTKKVCCFLIRTHYFDTLFNEKAWCCGGEVGVDHLNPSVTTWWTGVGYLHIYIVQITKNELSTVRLFFLMHVWYTTEWSPLPLSDEVHMWLHFIAMIDRIRSR